MPRCPTCDQPAGSNELIAAGPDKVLACGTCRKPKNMENESVQKQFDTRKQLFSLNVVQVQDRKGDSDYLIEVGVKSGALNFQFEATVDQIRTFFTERREKSQSRLEVKP